MTSAHCIALAAVLAILLATCAAQRRPPNYSLDDMPETSFDCRDKTIGGYYADPEADCQMFHVCVKMSATDIQDFRFLCPNDTMFDQENQICANWFDIDCEANSLYYSKGFDLLRVGNGPASDDILQRSPEPEKRLPTVITNRQKQQREEQELFRASSSGDIHRGRDEDDEEFERQNKKKAKVSVRRKQQNSRGRRPVVTTTQKVEEITTELPETNRPSVPDYTTINRNSNRNNNDQRGSTSTPNDFIRNTQRPASSVPSNNFQQKTSPPPPPAQKNNFQINVQSTPPQNNFQRNTFQTPAPNSVNQNSSPKSEVQNSSPQPRGDFRRNQNRNNFQTPPPAASTISNNHFDVPRTNPRNNGQQQQQRNNNGQQQPDQQRNNNGAQQQQQRNNVEQQQEQQRNGPQQQLQRNNNGQQQQQRNTNNFQQPQNNNFQQRTNQPQNNFQNQAPRNQQRNQPSKPASFVTPPPSTPFNIQRSSFEATTAQPSTFQQQNFPSSTLVPPFRNDRNQGFISSTVAPPQFSSTFAPQTDRQTFTNEINPSTLSPTTYNAFQQRKNAAAAARRNFQSTPIPNTVTNFNNNFNNNNQQRNFQSTAAPFQQSPSSVSQAFSPEITTPKPQFFPTTYTPQTYKNRPQENVPKPFQQRRTSRPRDDFNNNEHPDELLNTAQSAGIRASDLNAIQRTSVNYQSSTPFPAPSSPRSFTAPRQQTNRPRTPLQSTPPPAPFERSRGQPQQTVAPFEKIRTSPQQQQQFDNRRGNSNQPQNFNSQSTPFFNPSTVSPNFNTNAAKTNTFFNNPSSTPNFNSSPSKSAFNNPSTQASIRQSSQNNFFNPSTVQSSNIPTQNAFNSPSNGPSTAKPFFNSSPVQPQRPSTQNNFNPSTPQPFQQKSSVTPQQNQDTKPNKKAHKKANSDYDYAYYDETPYDEYDGIEHIDEFHKTTSKRNING